MRTALSPGFIPRGELAGVSWGSALMWDPRHPAGYGHQPGCGAWERGAAWEMGTCPVAGRVAHGVTRPTGGVLSNALAALCLPLSQRLSRVAFP